MLHDAGDENVLPVTDGVDFQLLAHQILVDEHGVLDALIQDDGHVLPHVFLVEGDDHVLPAQHVGGPQQHRVVNLGRRLKRFLRGHDGGALRTVDVQLLQQCVEPLAVLRHVDAVRRGAQHVDPRRRQCLGQLNGRLPAERHHHAVGLLGLDDAHHVLRRQRFEIQPVGGVEVGGHRLRVVVDDDHLVARFLQRPDAVDGGVVELDALADTDRAGAEDNDRLLAAVPAGDERGRLVFLVEGGVEIGRLRRELRRAGVHHLIRGKPLVLRLAAGQPLDHLVRIPHFLGPQIQRVVQLPGRQRPVHLHQLHQLVEEPGVDHGGFVDLLRRHPPRERLVYREQPLVVLGPHLGVQLLVGEFLHVRAAQAVQGNFRPPHRLHDGFLEGLADGHHLAGGLHLGAQGALGVNELVEGPFGELDD